ncbi:MAG TPA: hypothetical protein VFN51_00220 [Candidatus Saccharimonadales bacterium]|nr:hypothetical protein [Candidatus Saccharimonadales bacterium]
MEISESNYPNLTQAGAEDPAAEAEDIYPQVSFHRSLGQVAAYIDFNYEKYTTDMHSRGLPDEEISRTEILFVPELKHELIGNAAGTFQQLEGGITQIKVVVDDSVNQKSLNRTLAHEVEHQITNNEGDLNITDKRVFGAQHILQKLEADENFAEGKDAIHAARLAIYHLSQYERRARDASIDPADIVTYIPLPRTSIFFASIEDENILTADRNVRVGKTLVAATLLTLIAVASRPQFIEQPVESLFSPSPVAVHDITVTIPAAKPPLKVKALPHFSNSSKTSDFKFPDKEPRRKHRKNIPDR